jgi:hypothetical protein
MARTGPRDWHDASTEQREQLGFLERYADLLGVEPGENATCEAMQSY